MKNRNFICVLLASAILLSGCNSAKTVQTESSSEETAQTIEKIIFTEDESVTEASSEQKNSNLIRMYTRLSLPRLCPRNTGMRCTASVTH